MIKVTTRKGDVVRVCGRGAVEVVESPVFNDWLNRKFDHENLQLRGIEIQSSDIFGARVAFVKMKTDVVKRRSKKPVPGIVFLRGDSVTMLVFVVCKETGEIFVVTTKQARVPLGSAGFIEIPAGMLDDDEVNSRALAELDEETGLHINRRKKEKLRKLGKFTPSAGGCDEQITCFSVTIRVSRRKMGTIAKYLRGVDEENEEIAVEFLTVEQFLAHLQLGAITDGKAFAALMMFLLQNDSACTIVKNIVGNLVLGQ